MCACAQSPVSRLARIAIQCVEVSDPVSQQKPEEKSLKILSLLIVLMIWTVPAWPHEPMGHNCVAPERPVDDQDDVLWSRFLAAIDDFQHCVTAAADRHQAASDAHQRAAFAAVDAWNDFVHTSLNAPEDFPWPPEPD